MAKVQPEPFPDEQDASGKDDKIMEVPSTQEESAVTSRGNMMRIYGTVVRSIRRLGSTRQVHPDVAAQEDTDVNKTKYTEAARFSSEKEEEGGDNNANDKESAAYFRQRLESRGNALDNEFDIKRLQARNRLEERLKAKKTNSSNANVNMRLEEASHEADVGVVVCDVSVRDVNDIDGGYGDEKFVKPSPIASSPVA